MDTQQRAILGLGIALILSLITNAFLLVKTRDQNKILGVNSQYDYPCIYNAATRTLRDGDGTAFSCDANGALIITN